MDLKGFIISDKAVGITEHSSPYSLDWNSLVTLLTKLNRYLVFVNVSFIRRIYPSKFDEILFEG